MIHTLPDDDFLKEIMRLGGTSEELLYNKRIKGFIYTHYKE